MFKNILKKAQDKLVDKMIDKQLKQLPPEQREMIKRMVSKNPELFEKIAKEIKAKQKSGLGQQQAAMQVFMAHRDELQKLMQSSGGQQVVKMPGNNHRKAA